MLLHQESNDSINNLSTINNVYPYHTENITTWDPITQNIMAIIADLKPAKRIQVYHFLYTTWTSCQYT